ncbi:MAG: HNH endonuclease, partial [Planctomyces sp.]
MKTVRVTTPRKPVTHSFKRKGRTKRRFHVLQRDEFTCKKCEQPYPEDNLEVDHIIPLHQGGPDTLSNSQTLCIKCHQEKTKNER